MTEDHTVEFETYQLPLAEHNRPAAGEVHLWLWSLDDLAQRLMPAAHDGTANLPISVLTRTRRMTGRFFTRMILGAYLRLPGKAVHIIRRRRGRPELDRNRHGDRIRFNTSNSGGWQALAVASDMPVGVDIEMLRSRRDPLAVARRYFSAGEADAVQGASSKEQNRVFTAMWTRKEAVLKAIGCGLAGNIDRLRVSAEPNASGQVLSDPVSGQKWALHRIAPVGSLVGTVAVPQPEVPQPEVRVRGIRLTSRA